MATWRTDPYLWVHLAGLATVPLWLDLCLLGLAVGNPTLPGLELVAIAALGVLPVLAMQLLRPFYIFSLPGLVLRPRALRIDQRQMLTQFRAWRSRLGALLVPIPLVWLLLKLYPLAFLARELTPFGDWGRVGGVAIAIVGFALANLFLQVPVAVLQVLATPDRRMAAIAPYPVERVGADFMVLGLPLGRLLPEVAGPAAPSIPAVPGESEAPKVSISTPPIAPADFEEVPTSLADSGLVNPDLVDPDPVELEDDVTDESVPEAPAVAAWAAAIEVVEAATTEQTPGEEPVEVSAVGAPGATAESELEHSEPEHLGGSELSPGPTAEPFTQGDAHPAFALDEHSPLPRSEPLAAEPPDLVHVEVCAADGDSAGEAELPQPRAHEDAGTEPAGLTQADPGLLDRTADGEDRAATQEPPFIHPELENPGLEPAGGEGDTPGHLSVATMATPASALGQRHHP